VLRAVWYVPDVSQIASARLLLALLAAPATPPSPSPPPERHLTLAGEAPAEIHIAAEQSTVILFDDALVPAETRVEGASVPMLVTERAVVLFPSRELRAGAESVLSAGLIDGARVRLSLVFWPEGADVRVRIHRSPLPESAEDLRARLERCEHSQQGVEDIARYLLAHGSLDGLFSPRLPVEHVSDEREDAVIENAVDDQASGVTYLLLRLLSPRPFSVLRVQLTDAGGRELRVLHALPEHPSVAANEPTGLVLAYEPPSRSGLPAIHLYGSDGRVIELRARDASPPR